MKWVGIALSGLVAILAARTALADEPAMALTDLAAYRAALDDKSPTPARRANFRDLWDHAEQFQGHRVHIEGTLQRRFRQGAVGAFPSLVEAWLVSPAGDPFCAVFPDPKTKSAEPALGSVLAFEGTFLRKVRYQGSDTARLAPLVVGGEPPTVLKPGAGRGGSAGLLSGDRAWIDGMFGLTVALIVATVLARQHLKRSPARPPAYEPPPEFVEPS